MAGWEDAGGWDFDETAYPTMPAAAEGTTGKKRKKEKTGYLHVNEEDLLRPVKLTPGAVGTVQDRPRKTSQQPETKQAKKRGGGGVDGVMGNGGQPGKEKQHGVDEVARGAMELPAKKKRKPGQAEAQPPPPPEQQQQPPQQQQSESQSRQHQLQNGQQGSAAKTQRLATEKASSHSHARRAGHHSDGRGAPASKEAEGAVEPQPAAQKAKNKKKRAKHQPPADMETPPSPHAEHPSTSAGPVLVAPTATAAEPQHSRHRKQQLHSHTAAAGTTAASHSTPSAVETLAAPTAGPGPGSSSSSAAPSMLARLQAGAGGRGGSKLLEKMRQRLQGGAFRHLNELLYTSSSDTAFEEMQRDPSMFQQYHDGFQSQTRNWPMQPVQVAIQWLQRRPASWVVADFGCGDALLGRSVPQLHSAGPKPKTDHCHTDLQTVHSLDLVASAPGVIACNMAHTPLEAGSLDAAVFCLSLMGTDYGSFLVEACRLLKPKGWLWIAEVRSRFAAESSKDSLKPLVRALGRLGFVLETSDTSNTHFVIMILRKKGQVAGGDVSWPPLKPCLYKRR